MLAINETNYSQLLATAESLNELLTDVKICTTKSEFAVLACTAAADIIHKQGLPITNSLVETTARKLVDQGKITIREHVRLSEHGISVCLNVDTLDDPQTTWQAANKIQQALSLCGKHESVVYFGDELTYPLPKVIQLR